MSGIDARVILDTKILDKFNEKAPGLADSAVQVLLDEMIQDIDAHWSGFYPPASSPGEPPAIRTETLKKSAEKKRFNATTWGVRYLTPYANFLEFGTFKMRARPFVRPAQMRIQKQFKRVFSGKFRVAELTFGK